MIELRAHSKAGRLGCAAAIVLLATLAGCTRAHYRRQADQQTYEILAQKSRDAGCMIPDADITPDARSRFFDPCDPDCPPLPPDDPAAHRYMHCAYGMKGSKRWAELERLDHVENPQWPVWLGGTARTGPDWPLPTIEKLSLADAIEIGLINSRDYQEELENVYLAALALTYQRYRFDVRPVGFLGEPGLDLFYQHQPNDSSDLSMEGANLGISKLLPGGAQLVAELTNNTLWMFSGGNATGTATTFAYSLVQPLMRGAGREIVLENLTQAERDALYAVRDFARFRKNFYVTIVTGDRAVPLPGSSGRGELAFLIRGERSPTVGFYYLLYRYQYLRNVAECARSLERRLADLKDLEEAGRATSLDVTQLQSSLEESRSSALYSRRKFEDELDRFKLQLGLPPDIEVEIDDTLLEPFQFRSRALTVLEDRIGTFGDQLAWLQEMPSAARFEESVGQLEQLWHELADGFDGTEQKLGQLQEIVPDRERRMTAQVSGAFHEQVAADLQSYQQLREQFDQAHDASDRMEQFVAWDSLTPARQSELIDQIGTQREMLARLTRKLSAMATAVRVELIALDPVRYTPAEAVAMAVEHRLDLMNRRGFVVDARRRLEIAADRLESTVDLVVAGEINTPPVLENANPVDFRATESSFRAGVSVTTPLDRRRERNDFRAAQIAYDRARRNYMAAEDQVKLDVRADLRHVMIQGEVFEIQRRALRVAARELEQALESGDQADGNGGSRQGVDIPRALDNIVDAQNSLIDTWVDYEIARLGLYRDMGTMAIGPDGVWNEEQPGS